MIAALAFGRPIAFALLVLPIAVILLARRHTRPESDATGTLELWRRSAVQVTENAARVRSKLPPWAWWIVLALVLGIVALADPRPSQARAENELLVVVDRSPSMYLADDGRTRLAHALEMAHDVIARYDADHVIWIAPPAGSSAKVRGNALPAEWGDAPRVPRDLVDFGVYDRPGALWITDRAPESAPRWAGFVASGGARVVGSIGVHDGRLVEWDGTRVSVSSVRAPERRVTIAERTPDWIARLARTWAAARGLACVSDTEAQGESAALELSVHAPANAESALVATNEAGRDGWLARGTFASGLKSIDDDGVLERWLVDPASGATLVASGPGRIRIAFATLEPPRGDPAAFAVSWSQLFDSCALDPTACVPLSERAGAGKPARKALSSEAGAGRDPARVWTALVALGAVAAALCASVAFNARGRARIDPLP